MIKKLQPRISRIIRHCHKCLYTLHIGDSFYLGKDLPPTCGKCFIELKGGMKNEKN